MITVDIKQLVSALMIAEPFTMPPMRPGAAYLYNTVYRRLSQNMDVRLSELDFDSFDSEDIAYLKELYDEVLENNSYKAGGIITELRKIIPVCKSVGYI